MGMAFLGHFAQILILCVVYSKSERTKKHRTNSASSEYGRWHHLGLEKEEFI
jgi:hypothetical protein